MLETVREHALERLEESGEAKAVRRAHAQFFLELAEEAEPRLRTAERNPWLDRLEQEQGNLRAALTWSHAEPEASELLARLAGALYLFWVHSGRSMEGRGWLDGALARSEGLGRTRVRAKLLHGAGALAGWRQGEITLARARLEEDVALWRELGDTHGLAYALSNLCMMASSLGDHTAARSFAEESVALWRQLEDRDGLVLTLYFLGNVALAAGDLAAARAHYEESRGIGEELRDPWALARPVAGLGHLARRQGDYPTARAFYELTVALRREQRDASVGWFLNDLAAVARDQGDLPAARSFHEEALVTHGQTGHRPGIIQSLVGLGTVALCQGDDQLARSCFERSLAPMRELGSRWPEIVGTKTIAECLEGLAGVTHLGAKEKLKAQREARDRGPGSGEARLEWAARLLGAASRLRESGNVPLSPIARTEHERGVAFLRSALGDGSLAAAWAEGRGMQMEEIIGEALGETT
jgi:tetratricopeptide (TPR) repeat protein